MILVRFCQYKFIVRQCPNANIFNELQQTNKNLGAFKLGILIYIMVNRFIMPPNGLPNQGFRKKINVRH